MMMERDRRLTGHVRGQRVRHLFAFVLFISIETILDGSTRPRNLRDK
jgi:hypothetical protein